MSRFSCAVRVIPSVAWYTQSYVIPPRVSSVDTCPFHLSDPEDSTFAGGGKCYTVLAGSVSVIYPPSR